MMSSSHLTRLVSPSALHPRSALVFKSFPQLMAETQRYLKNVTLLHPLSMLCFWWTAWMCLVYYARLIMVPLRFCFVIDDFDHLKLHMFDVIILMLQTVCMLDVVVTACTAVYDERKRQFILDRNVVWWRYMNGWFAVDAVSCLPWFCVAFWPQLGGRTLLVAQLLAHLAFVKVVHLLRIIEMIISYRIRSRVYRICIIQLVKFFLIIHSSTCVTYVVYIIYYHWTGEEVPTYNELLRFNNTPLSLIPMTRRYWKSLFLNLSTYLGTGFVMYKLKSAPDVIISTLVLITSELYILYIITFFLDFYISRHNSRTKYYELMNLVENYISDKQFSPNLKKRILTYYLYKYNSMFYEENDIYKNISEHLFQEMELDRRRKLAVTVKLFHDVPHNLVAVLLASLQPEVYLPGDMITRCGETGDCMYFIALGTVALYTSKGVEMCHLDDGNYFGETVLIMSDNRHIFTVVSIDNTELYRLDRPEFRKYVLSNELLMQKVLAIGVERINRIVHVDEEYRRMKETTPHDSVND